MNIKHTNARAWLCGIIATGAILYAYFGRVLTGEEVFYAGDIARIYLPQRVVLSQALAARSLPWWASGIGAGYPLLAEGEVGALYPPNWILYSLLAPEIALSVSVVLHYLWAGLGFYLYARWIGASRKAAYVGALVLALGGFYIAHLSHVSIITTAAWLPWMFALTHALLASQLGKGTPVGLSLGLALVTALQFWAGHAQISVLGFIALAAYALFVVSLHSGPGIALSRLGLWLGALLVGTLMAAPQLLATIELAGLSQRAGGLDSAFFTSYSFHPALLITFLSPFAWGNPYPHGSVELMGYVGLLPLALSAGALWRSQVQIKWFFLGLAVIGVFLAFGRWNPLYQYLRLIPFLNLFRAPARYLYWTSFALASLSTIGFDAFCQGVRCRTRAGWALLGFIGLALGLALAVVWTSASTERLVANWRWLPLVLAAASLSLILAGKHVATPAWTIAALGLVWVDAYAYGAVLKQTYSSTLPYQEVAHKPRALAFLSQDTGFYRIYVKEEILPTLSVMRESFYPNLALTAGLSSANIYLPLVPRSYASYLNGLNAQRLNRLNVKYYLIPQLLPVDEERELYDVHNPFAALPANTWLSLPPLELSGLEVESYLSHAVAYEDGHLVAELVCRDVAGQELVVPLRAGVETAEWAYEREDVRANIRHRMPPVATTFPARSGFPPQDHNGHTYVMRLRLDRPLRIGAVMWRPRIPEAFVRLERVRLLALCGDSVLLAHLLGRGDHSLIYRSEDVVIYRNEDALPRAYTVPASMVVSQGEEVILPEVLTRGDVRAVDVLEYTDTYVALRASLEEPGYLVLADLDYPGWKASVDGIEVPILRADGIFRALALTTGEHHVLFEYEPTPLALLRALTRWKKR